MLSHRIPQQPQRRPIHLSPLRKRHRVLNLFELNSRVSKLHAYFSRIHFPLVSSIEWTSPEQAIETLLNVCYISLKFKISVPFIVWVLTVDLRDCGGLRTGQSLRRTRSFHFSLFCEKKWVSGWIPMRSGGRTWHVEGDVIVPFVSSSTIVTAYKQTTIKLHFYVFGSAVNKSYL